MRHSIGQARLDQADMARDMKKEEDMCAMATCTGNTYKRAPSGWGPGRYGGYHLCKEHYREVVDKLAKSVINGTDPYWED